MESTETEEPNAYPTEWDRLPRTAIRIIAQHMIKNEGFLQVQHNLALNRHWYDAVMDPSLETHLKLFVKSSTGKTRTGFEKLRKLLVTFEPKQGLKHLKHLEFTNFNNHMNKESFQVRGRITAQSTYAPSSMEQFLMTLTLKLYKTMDILNDRNFELRSLVIQTSTIGNIKTLSTFAEKHCKNLEKFTLTALRLPPKGLSLLFRIDLNFTMFR